LTTEASPHMDQSLLAKYISGVCNDSERQAVEAWKSESAEHAAELARLQKLWEAAASPTTYTPDTNEAWKKLEARIRTEAETGQETVRPLWPRLLRAAAVLAILVAAGWFLFEKDTSVQSPGWTVYSAVDSVKTVSLADGSTVTLNRHSRLEVSPDFGKERKTRLNGEAFFEVAKQGGKRFRVDLGESKVEVLGTKFNVRNDAGEELVSVEEGKVAFSREQSQSDSLHLTQGQSAGLISKEIKRVPSPDPNFMAWRTGRINFSKSPMSYVEEVLEKSFGRDIYLPVDLESCEITAKFDQNSFESIIMVIAAALDTEAIQSGSQWSLEGGSCK
jgi:transmembrane sensor